MYLSNQALTVCGSCFVLNGGTGTSRQLCRCATADEHRALGDAAYQRDGTYWHRAAEICRCCGAEVLNASHKFAVWFCPRCKDRAVEVNRALGSCVIPIGWHSIVNGVFVSSNRCKTLVGATGAADELNAFFRESGSLSEWGDTIVERQWRRAGLPVGHNVAIERYLDAVWTADVDKEALFEELLAAHGVPSNWRDFEAVPLELIWLESDGGRCFEASEETVWVYPDGEDEFAGLTLRVIASSEGAWTWQILLEQETAGEADPLLVHGTAPTLETAKADCEAAALRLIAEQEEQLARREDAEKEALLKYWEYLEEWDDDWINAASIRDRREM